MYSRLFVFPDFARSVRYLLFLVLIGFAIIEILALWVGTHLTQTVTGAVAHLYDATRHINRGDFGHRVPVRSQDQLSTLGNSFNSMAESLQKLIEEQKQKQRLENELVIAQEVQAQLFPRQISQLPTLELHGFCRPARTVSGDYYDFLPIDSNKLVLAVGDVSGEGNFRRTIDGHHQFRRCVPTPWKGCPFFGKPWRQASQGVQGQCGPWECKAPRSQRAACWLC